MRVTTIAFFGLLAAACAIRPHDPERAQLVRRHDELFTWMGLSRPAVDELCGKVAWVYDGMQQTRERNPEAFHALEGVTRRGNPQNEQEAMAAHRDRFAALGLTPETQRELEQAFVAVYRDLHSDSPSERAIAIRQLMAELPPCCDDAIFERAGASP